MSSATQRPAVLQVILSREFAGTERQVAELAQAIGERGWRSLIAARADISRDARRVFDSAAQVVDLRGDSRAGLASAVALVLRHERAAVVNGHLGAGTAAALGAGILAGVPVVSTLHFIAPRHSQARTAALQRPVYRAMLRRLDAVIAVSNAVGDYALTAVRAHGPPVHVVRNGLRDLPAPDQRSRAASGAEPVVLFVGRLSPEKQVALLIEAMSNGPPNARLWIAGEGQERERLRRLADQLMPGRVALLGFVSDIEGLMQRASVLAVPSRGEGFGLVALEAMRAALPVVGFAAGALPEIVEDGVTGLLAERGNVSQLSAVLRRILADPALASSLGAAGQRRFRRLFTADRMAAETEAVYQAVIRRRTAAPVSA